MADAAVDYGGFISQSGFTDEGAANLNRLVNLKELRLDQNEQLTPDGLFALEKCVALESLNLSGLPVGKLHFQRMAGFTKLKRLDLTACDQVTGEDVGLLTGCEGLEEINFTGCRRIDSPDLMPLKQFKNLKKLSFSNTRIKTDGIIHLQSLDDLESIDLSACKWVDDESVAAVAQIPSLKTVFLNSNSRITDQSLQHLGQLPVLAELYLSQNKKVTGSGLAAFSESESLRVLKMDGLDALTPEGLGHLVKIRSLEELLIRCRKLTNEHFSAMMGIPGLKKFEMDNTDHVNSGIYRKWVNSLPSYGK